MQNIVNKVNDIKFSEKKSSFKRLMLGNGVDSGWLHKAMIYFLLIVIGFVFVYPILYMLSTALMSNLDLANFRVKWIPSSLYTDNITIALRALALPKSLFTTIFIAGISTIFMVISSSLIGYGLARFEIPFKRVILVLLLLSYIMPKTLFLIPTYQIYTTLGLRNNIFGILLPIMLGQGIQGAFFILIFFQFFKMIPKALEEAATIDGANSFVFFYKIAIRMAAPAIIIASVFSFALYWNEIRLYTVYSNGQYQTIPMLLQNLRDLYYAEVPRDTAVDPNLRFSEAKAYAGTLISIIPPIIFFAIIQRWFVESIDKSGITGE